MAKRKRTKKQVDSTDAYRFYLQNFGKLEKYHAVKETRFYILDMCEGIK